MQIAQISDSVHVVKGTNVNWAVVSDGTRVTLIDAGYPSDSTDVLDSVRQLGFEPDAIAAVLITHAHLDHIGGVPALVDGWRTPVYTGAEEVRHAHREYLQQITPIEMIKQLGTSRGRGWVFDTLPAVRGHIKMSVPSAEVGDEATLAALPGGIVAIATPGHTNGHTAYFIPSEGVLFSGDTLVTGHPLSLRTGFQILPGVFNHDEAGTMASARALAEVPASVLVPGHGDVRNFDAEELTQALRGQASA